MSTTYTGDLNVTEHQVAAMSEGLCPETGCAARLDPRPLDRFTQFSGRCPKHGTYSICRLNAGGRPSIFNDPSTAAGMEQE